MTASDNGAVRAALPLGRAAIVLGGGRSQRMGRDKLGLPVGGQTILQRTVDAALDWAHQVVVAGPGGEHLFPDTEKHVTFVREKPPFGGPAAGIGAGVGALEHLPPHAQILVLAGDLAHPKEAVAALTRQDATGLDREGVGKNRKQNRRSLTDGLVLVEAGGWPQLLIGRYRLGALRRAVAAAGPLEGLSVRKLMEPLDLRFLRGKDTATRDVDTPSDYKKEFG